MPYTLDENGVIQWSDTDPTPGPSESDVDYNNQSPVPSIAQDNSMQNPNGKPGFATMDDLVNSIAGPVPTVQPQAPQNQSQGQSGSVSVSGSKSGIDFSPGGAWDQMNTKGMTGFNKDVAQGHNAAVQYGEQLAQGVPENIQAQKDASNAVTEAEIAKNDAGVVANQKIADMQRQSALDNATDYANIQTKVMGKMAEYEAAVKDLASSTINPGRAYSNLTDGMKGGVLATAFVTDFLGAKGIKTHGMDYINQAIERDIQAQRDEIDLKKDVAQGKMNIYKMFKEQGDSDYLAKEKTRGALFEAMKTEINGKLAMFDSPIARARAQQANALIDKTGLDIRNSIYKATLDEEHTRFNQSVAVQNQRLEGARIAEQRAARLQQADQWKKEHSPKGIDIEDLKKNGVFDNDGKFIGYVAAGGERVNKVQDIVQNTQSLQRELKELSDVLTKIYDGPGGRLFKDKEAAKYESRYYQMLYKIARANDPGGRFTDKDVEVAAKQVPFNTISYGLANGGGTDAVDAVLGQIGRGTFKNLQEYVNANITPVDNPDIIKAIGTRGASPGSLQSSQAYNAFSETLGTKPVTGDVARLKGEINSQGGKINSPARVDDKEVINDASDLGIAQIVGNSYTVPSWFDKMEQIATIARDVPGAKPDKSKFKTDGEYNDAVKNWSAGRQRQQQALNALYEYTKGTSNTPGMQPNDITEQQANAALYLIHSLKSQAGSADLNYPDEDVVNAIVNK